MKFIPLPLDGAYLIELELKLDERGYFARIFCEREFAAQKLVTNFVQISTAHNIKAGQIRGMHYQESPHEETKIVRCTKGAVYDVMLDLREDSPTFKQWWGTELSEDNCKMVYIPRGFAHGYKTLVKDTELLYMMDQFYQPEYAREIPVPVGIFE